LKINKEGVNENLPLFYFIENYIVLAEKSVFGWKSSVFRLVKKNNCAVYLGKLAIIFQA